ncbi:hypothetical protein CDAR_554021 [Caerostris darwini]|uniref:Uncharacterized protein n=1 Tax=Caerostris darwini TaxID=1538125 RepID=A0AAV4X7H1_9ARAC|nr:hypothetical protein CDAR_554021 [Caerostris darwini]
MGAAPKTKEKVEDSGVFNLPTINVDAVPDDLYKSEKITRNLEWRIRFGDRSVFFPNGSNVFSGQQHLHILLEETRKINKLMLAPGAWSLAVSFKKIFSHHLLQYVLMSDPLTISMEPRVMAFSFCSNSYPFDIPLAVAGKEQHTVSR